MNDLVFFLLAMIVPGAVVGMAIDTARVMWRRSRDRRAPARPRDEVPGWCPASPWRRS